MNKMLVSLILVIVFLLLLFVVIFPLIKGSAGNIFGIIDKLLGS